MDLINGRVIAEDIFNSLKLNFPQLPFKPSLADILIGEDQVSKSYVRIKENSAKKLGADFIPIYLPGSAKGQEVIDRIETLQKLPNLCGLIIQLPMPKKFDKQKILAAIDPANDIDCLTEKNTNLLHLGNPVYTPPTAAAVLEILKRTNADFKKQSVLIIGKGELVGKPVALLLRKIGANYKVASKETKDLSKYTLNAEIIISGAGHPRLLNARMVRDNCVIIDAGTAESGGKIIGDVDLDSFAGKPCLITPVPGGVGPVTVAMLYQNLLQAAQRKAAFRQV